MVQTNNKLSKAKIALLATSLSFVLFSNPAFAADLSSINNFLTQIQTALKGIGVAVVTIAFMIAGYKVVFGGSTVREVVPIAIGALIIGAAAYLAGLVIK